MQPRSRQYNETDQGLASTERRDWIVVLPLGAHEQHGPHLPFDTDTLIAEGLAERLKKALPDSLPVTFLPVEPVGYSIEHMDVEGTKTLSFDEAVNRWLGIAEDLHRQGIRKFVMLNAHGGNSPLMTIVATEARIRFGMLAVATSWTRFGQPEGWIAPEDKAIDIHGGDIETSVMLALWPDRVDMTKLPPSSPARETSRTNSNTCAPTARTPSAGRWPTSTKKASPAMPQRQPPNAARNWWRTRCAASSNCWRMWRGLTWRR